jgi:hypothetical protein
MSKIIFCVLALFSASVYADISTDCKADANGVIHCNVLESGNNVMGLFCTPKGDLQSRLRLCCPFST